MPSGGGLQVRPGALQVSPLLQFIITLMGVILDHIPHEEAQLLLSEEAKRRANAKADAVAAARVLAGG